MSNASLPYVDEHATVIAAGRDDVWGALLDTIEATFTWPSAGCYARAVGCTPATASGPRPVAEGSTFPGFGVVSAIAGKALLLEGRHRFSNYALHFELDALDPNSTRLRATTRAEFPGPLGRAYRMLVIGSRGHVLAVRRLLNAVDRRSVSRSVR